MTKGTLVFLLGIVLIVLPYLGIPSTYKFVAIVVAGVLLVLIGYALRRTQYLVTLDHDADTRTSETFVETTKQLFQ